MESKYTELEYKGAILALVHLVLVDIRDAKSLNATKKLSDIIHNVPLYLRRANTVDDYEKILVVIENSARKYDLRDYLKNLIQLAFEQR